VLDIITTGGNGQAVIDGNSPPYEMFDKNNGWIEIARVMEAYPDVNYRYIMSPSKDLIDTVDWLKKMDPDKIRQFALAGEIDAHKQLE
jgi:hypothetical protein